MAFEIILLFCLFLCFESLFIGIFSILISFIFYNFPISKIGEADIMVFLPLCLLSKNKLIFFLLCAVFAIFNVDINKKTIPMLFAIFLSFVFDRFFILY